MSSSSVQALQAEGFQSTGGFNINFLIVDSQNGQDEQSQVFVI
jgi:hypothetical protein